MWFAPPQIKNPGYAYADGYDDGLRINILGLYTLHNFFKKKLFKKSIYMPVQNQKQPRN